jgi:hypothetical protein
LEAAVGSGNSPQKHVLLSADGVGTMAIQRQTGKGKPTIAAGACSSFGDFAARQEPRRLAIRGQTMTEACPSPS